MKPSDVQPNAFSENLNDDEWVAVNAQGTVIGRAGSEDSIRHANPTAEAWFNGKQLRDGNTAKNPFDRDGDGQAGGAPKGGNRKAGTLARNKDGSLMTAGDGSVIERNTPEVQAMLDESGSPTGPLPAEQNASMNGGKTGSPENPPSAEDPTPDPPLGDDGGQAAGSQDGGEQEDIAPDKGAALAHDPKAGHQHGGHKDDPGNTHRKAAAGGHAKQPTGKK